MESYPGISKAKVVAVVIRDFEGKLYKMISRADGLSLWMRNIKFYQQDPQYLAELLRTWGEISEGGENRKKSSRKEVDISEDVLGYVLIDFSDSIVLINSQARCPLFSIEPSEIGWMKTKSGRDYKNQITQNLVDLYDAGLIRAGITYSWDESGVTHGVSSIPGYIRSSESLVNWLHDTKFYQGARIVINTSPWRFQVFDDNMDGWRNLVEAVKSHIDLSANKEGVWRTKYTEDVLDQVLEGSVGFGFNDVSVGDEGKVVQGGQDED